MNKLLNLFGDLYKVDRQMGVSTMNWSYRNFNSILERALESIKHRSSISKPDTMFMSQKQWEQMRELFKK